MAFVVYFFVLLITAGSVLFGLDWAQAPMSPMPRSQYELHAAKPPPPPPSVMVEKKPEPESEPEPVKTVSQPPSLPSPAETTAAAPAPIVAPEPVAAAEPPPPKCDIAACDAAYRSFTPEDCTYQPFDGPRQLCTRGTPPAAAAQATPEATSQSTPQAPTSDNARAQASCNVAACSDAYFTRAEPALYSPPTVD